MDAAVETRFEEGTGHVPTACADAVSAYAAEPRSTPQ
jgi:hypothetical protein